MIACRIGIRSSLFCWLRAGPGRLWLPSWKFQNFSPAPAVKQSTHSIAYGKAGACEPSTHETGAAGRSANTGVFSARYA